MQYLHPRKATEGILPFAPYFEYFFRIFYFSSLESWYFRKKISVFLWKGSKLASLAKDLGSSDALPWTFPLVRFAPEESCPILYFNGKSTIKRFQRLLQRRVLWNIVLFDSRLSKSLKIESIFGSLLRGISPKMFLKTASYFGRRHFLSLYCTVGCLSKGVFFSKK